MPETYTISPLDSQISESLKFWQSRSASTQKSKRVSWQSPIWLVMLGSIAAHTAFWLLLPNPIKQDLSKLTAPKISTISVVTLPPEVLLRANKRLAPSSLPPLNLNQLNLPNLPTPAYDPSLLPPPPLLSVLPQGEPRTSNLRSVPNVSNLQPNLAINSKQSNLNFETGTSNIRPEITITPSDGLLDNSSNNLINNPKPEINNPKPDEIPPKSTPSKDPVTGYSYKASDLIAANFKPIPKTSSGDLTGVVAQYGADGVIQRQIASPDTPVPPDKREPIDWIPIAPQTGISGTVAFVLVVNPDGRIAEEPIVAESTNSKLEQIARETIKGYYNKFQPIEQNKQRLVRIQYRIP